MKKLTFFCLLIFDLGINANSQIPIGVTNPASGVSQSSAILNGFWNSNGVPLTFTHFEWGATPSLGNFTVTVDQGSIGNANALIISLTPNTTYYFRIVVQNSNGTTYGNILNFKTLMNPLKADFTISDLDNQICAGEYFNLTNTSTGSIASYYWDAWQSTTPTWGFENIPPITYYGSGYWAINLTVYDSLGNQNTKTKYITVWPTNWGNITPANPPGFCEGDSVKLTANAGSYYTWLLEDDTIISSASAQSIFAKQSGNYLVNITDGVSGCKSKNSVFAYSYSKAEPRICVNNDCGKDTFYVCANESVRLSTSYYVSYLWSNGSSSDQIYISSSGNYWIRIVDGNGCSGISDTITVIINPIPEPVITITPNQSSFCEGDTVRLEIKKYKKMFWYSYGKDNSWYSEGVSNIFITETSNTSVNVVDFNGCSAYSLSVNLQFNELPEKPEIINNNCELATTSGYKNYQWFFKDSLLAGEETQFLTVNQSGFYVVEVFDNNGCSSLSDPFYVDCQTTSGINEFSDDGGVNIYPNPIKDFIKVEIIDFLEGSDYQLVIYDLLGKQVFKQKLSEAKTTIKRNNLISGMYLARIFQDNEKHSVKNIKLFFADK